MKTEYNKETNTLEITCSQEEKLLALGVNMCGNTDKDGKLRGQIREAIADLKKQGINDAKARWIHPEFEKAS